MAMPISPYAGMIPDWQQPVQDPFSVQTPVPRPQLAMADWSMPPPAPNLKPAVAPPKPKPFDMTPMPSQGEEPQSYAAMLQGIKERGDAMAAEQRRGADFMRQGLDPLMQGDIQTDLSPLAALVDTWSGSNLRAGYKAPETGKERRAEIQNLQKGIANAGIQASATELDALKELASGTFGLEKFAAEQKYKKDSLAVQQEQNAINRAKAAMHGGIDPAKGFGMRTTLSKLEPATQARGVTGFVAALNEYEQAVDKFDGNPSSASAASVRSAYTKMSTRFKEAEKLGALAGPDLELLRQNVANAGTWENFAFGGTKGGKQGIKAAIAQTRRGADNDFKLAMNNLTGVAGESLPVLQPVLSDYQKAYNAATGGTPASSGGPDLSGMTDDQLRAIAAGSPQ